MAVDTTDVIIDDDDDAASSEPFDKYFTLKDESLVALTDVKTVKGVPCSMSRVLAPLSPMLEELVLATQFEKSMVPKSTKAISLPPDRKSSTTHSALVPQREEVEVRLLVAVFPVVRLMMVATPAVRLVAWTVVVTTL